MRSVTGAVWVLLLLSVTIATGWAQDPPPTGNSEQLPAFGSAAPTDGATPARRAATELSLVPFFLYAGVVLLALFGAIALVRRFGQRGNWFAPAGPIKILARRAIGPSQSLLLVEVGNRVLRLGLTRDGMVYLGEIVEAEEIARIKGAAEAERPDSVTSNFSAALQTSTRELAAEPGAPAPGRLDDVKQELASIRRAVQGWAGGGRGGDAPSA